MDEILEFAIRCVKESGRIQRRYLGKKIGIHHKGVIDLVTDVDMACQETIIGMINKAFPGNDIISEEKKNYFESDGNRWIIDPLDGTTNYAHSYPFFCTSIAYEEGGTVTAGAVYNPIFKELFYARKGQGAYFNGKMIRVSKIGVLKQALLSTGFPYDLHTSKNNNIDNFISFIYEAQAIRRDGSAALNLCYLACGRFDGFWEIKLQPWDIAAGSLIVEEAGGVLTDFQGGRFTIHSDEIIASNGLIHDDMLRILQMNKFKRGI